jgi:uncharacterized protein (TIGR03067 family)
LCVTPPARDAVPALLAALRRYGDDGGRERRNGDGSDQDVLSGIVTRIDDAAAAYKIRSALEEIEPEAAGPGSAIVAHQLELPDREKEDAKQLEGKWRLTRMEKEGKDLSNEAVKELRQRLILGASDFRLEVRGKPSLEGTWEADSKRSPKRITLRAIDKKFGGELAFHAIYEFRRETLVVCVGEGGSAAQRRFVTEPGDGLRIEYYEKEKE